jgi:hypothetical protein
MRRERITGVFATTAALVLLLRAAAARADDIDEGEPFRSIDIQLNPIGIVVGRYTLDLEYLPAPHHAVHLTPVGYYAVPASMDTFQGFGAEAGYRWYSSANGPEGIFVGGSFLIGGFEYAHSTANPSTLDPADDTQFVSLGGAIDAGFQWVPLGNFAFGAGAGVAYTVYTEQPRFNYANHSWEDLVYGSGLRPRVLLSVGTAF